MTTAELDADPHPVLARLRAAEPVSWLPALGRWLVTERATAVAVLRDAETFTVDDPRFSTARVLGPSMLSLDGEEQRRHRTPFAAAFGRDRLERDQLAGIERLAAGMVAGIADRGRADLRTELAGPFAAAVITRLLGLTLHAPPPGAEPSSSPTRSAVTSPSGDGGPEPNRSAARDGDGAEPTGRGAMAGEGVNPVLGWYRAIVQAVNDVDAGRPISADGHEAIASLRAAVDRARLTDDPDATGVPAAGEPGLGWTGTAVRGGVPGRSDGSIVAEVAAVLNPDEVFSNAAVVMFGAIETVEGMLTNALFHLLTRPALLTAVMADRALLPATIEESLRVEPAAALVDRYATADVRLGAAAIERGDLVSVSLSGANRDPAAFAEPDRFNPYRSEAGRHLAFVQGPHACPGAALARLEVGAMLDAVLDGLPDLRLDPAAPGPTGIIFRKPVALPVTWAIPTG